MLDSRRPRVFEADAVVLGLDQQQRLPYLVGLEAQLRRVHSALNAGEGQRECAPHSSAIA